MQKITLTIKDDNKIKFLLELLRQFDFVDIHKATETKEDGYNFFASAGIWKNRDVSASQLRDQAWKRN